MRRAGLGKKRAEILSSGALELAVLGAGTRKEIGSVSCLWNLNQRAGCIEGSLEAIPSGNTPFVRDPGAFLIMEIKPAFALHTACEGKGQRGRKRVEWL